MRILNLRIAGYRGFNEERLIEFDERLNLVSAANSYGKTSIAEALEMLLFGETSKVAHADSKEEFRNSYRNRHYAVSEAAFIEGVFTTAGDATTALRVEIAPDETIRRYVNGKPVTAWPFEVGKERPASPFIVQHELKELLHTAPAERFLGFARLLGLHSVDAMQRTLVNLATKPEANLSQKASDLLAKLDGFEGRLSAVPALGMAAKSLAGALSNPQPLKDRLGARVAAIAGLAKIPMDPQAAAVSARDDRVRRIFSGTVEVAQATQQVTPRQSAFRESLRQVATSDFLTTVGQLSAQQAFARLRKQESLLKTGLELLADEPHSCPLCSSELGTDQQIAISERHRTVKEELDSPKYASNAHSSITNTLEALSNGREAESSAVRTRFSDLTAADNQENRNKIESLFGEHGKGAWLEVSAAIGEAVELERKVTDATAALDQAVQAASLLHSNHLFDVAAAERLAIVALDYSTAVATATTRADQLSDQLVAPAKALKEAIDGLAGTSELSLIIELLEALPALLQALRVRAVVEKVKALKKPAEQAIGEVMEAAFTQDLTASVNRWYSRIRTSGDPDVHFSGFSMDKTKAGDFKSRKVKIGAHSYGVELASAVSSLSESKLNALGLCVSIATALRPGGCFAFVLLDDPVQSWDEDHEVQFQGIVRDLVEVEGKQIILLSHRESWIDGVAQSCRTLNGRRFRITGYDKGGPSVSEVEWAPVDQRLTEALAIARDASASAVKLQQAEAEMRIAAGQLVSEVARVKLKRILAASKVNSGSARAILVEAACPSPLVDRVIATFNTTDDAHHAPAKYQPSRERVMQYHGSLAELRSWMRSPL